MSPERNAFLRAICENPDDITSRLVFADWLQEHDEADHAEFIRIQCGDPHPHPHYPGARFSYQQHRSIDKRLGWVADVNRLLRTAGHGGMDEPNFGTYSWNECADGSVWMEIGSARFTLRRGFVEEVAIPCTRFMVPNFAAELFRLQPVTKLVLTDKSPAVEEAIDIWCFHNILWQDSWREHVLPNELAPHISGEHSPSSRLVYAAVDVPRGTGHGSLLRGCVRYGRIAAGLPPIEA